MSPEQIRTITVDPRGLTPEELEDFAMKHRIVSLMEGGLSAREAVEHLPECDYTPAWANKQRRRYRDYGAPGLLDLRKFNGKETEVMTQQVKAIVLKYWHGLPAAGVNIIARNVAGECKKLNVRPPTESTVRAYLDSLPEPEKLSRGAHMDVWDKQARPVQTFRGSKRACERYQSDHARLQLWGRVLKNGEWEPVQVWLTAHLDDYSRAIPGIAVSIGSANSWSITRSLRHAILPKEEPGWEIFGVPDILQTDQGGDYMSHAITTALGVLGIRHDPDPPYYPDGKGKIERFFRTLDEGCLRGLPGHMEAIGKSEGAAKKNLHKLLTPEQIEREIKIWIVEEYHQRRHSSTKRKPIELWQETAQPRLPSEGEVFRALLHLDEGVRTVGRTVDFTKDGEGGSYWSPDILALWGRKVRVGYHPADMSRIVLHCQSNGEFLAELWLLDHEDCPYDWADVKRAASQYRHGLKSRAAKYRKEHEQQEIAAREAEEWEEARSETESDSDPDPEPIDPEDAEAEKILKEINERNQTDRN